MHIKIQILEKSPVFPSSKSQSSDHLHVIATLHRVRPQIEPSATPEAAHRNPQSGILDPRMRRRQHTKRPTPAFLHVPQASALNFPVCPYRCISVSRLFHHQASCVPSRIRRREMLQTLPFVSLYLLPKPCQANIDDEITFTKLPCETDGCSPVEIHDYRVGTGMPAENGCRITVKWTGRLADRYGWPIQKEDADQVSFLLGTDQLIRGFEIAIQGMREGGKRRMIIPAELGYKDEKHGPLPASYGDRRRLFATVLNRRRFKRAGDLVIDVQLLKVRPPR